MRIAVFADAAETSCHYRAIEPMLELARNGHDVRINGRDGEISPEMRSFDVVVISRYVGAEAQRIAQELRDAGLAVVWECDDAVTLAPELSPSALKIQRRRSEVQAMVRLADVVTTTSEPLAGHFRALGAERVHVVENYLGGHFARLRRDPHDGLVLGWAAWADHQADWRQLGLRETVTRLLDAHPQLRVESVGLVSLNLPRDRYRQSDVVPLDRLGSQLTRFDIGIAPIVDTPFNRSRSNVKVKEYAAAGAAWLASPIGPYERLGRKQGGQLVPDDGWYAAVDELLAKPRLLRKLAKRASKWGASQLLADNTSPWEAALAEAVERARANRSGRRTPAPATPTGAMR